MREQLLAPSSVLLAIVAMVLVLLALHPFVTYPLSLMFVRRRTLPAPAPVARDRRPTLAICMAAYNEERVIVAKAESLLAMATEYGPATVHVYVDGASDRTAELLAPFADRIDVVVSEERRGKTAGLNLLLERSGSALVAFTDANVVTPRNAMVELAAPFAHDVVGCTTARLEYTNNETATASAGSVYWRIEEALKRAESETVGVIGVDGACFMMRRELYRAAPANLIDDLYCTLEILIAGRRVVSVDHVVVTERSATGWLEEFRRKRRIACQAFNVHRVLRPRLRTMRPLQRYAYLSHRLLKWLMPFTLLLAGIAAFAFLANLFGFAPMLGITVAGILLLGLAAWAGVRVARLPFTALASLGGVGAGVFQSVFQRRDYQVWTPAASVRD